MKESDEKWCRERMLEVLRANPIRAMREDTTTRELVDLVCGDLLQARARIERQRARADVDAEIAEAVQALRECNRVDADPEAVRTRVAVALSALHGCA